MTKLKYINSNLINEKIKQMISKSSEKLADNQVRTEGGMIVTFSAMKDDEDDEKKEKYAVIDIDGAIGFDFWKWLDDEPQNTAESIKARLQAITADEIIVNINSPGGVVNDGVMIHDLLSEHPAKVTTRIRGLTASAGTLISQAGDVRAMSSNAVFLPHNVFAGICGYYNRIELRTIANELDKLCDIEARIYARKSAHNKEYFQEVINRANGHGEWYTAEEALEMGLIDEIFEPADLTTIDSEEDAEVAAAERAVQYAAEAKSFGLQSGDIQEIAESIYKSFHAKKENGKPSGSTGNPDTESARDARDRQIKIIKRKIS